jgi:hypothetical protein
MKPTKAITDPTFTYVDSNHTNIRERFNKVRKELKIPPPKQRAEVVPIKKEKG